MIEFDVYRPVVRSVTATPTLTGGPSLAPVICINPNSLHQISTIQASGPHNLRFHHHIVASAVAVRSGLSVAGDAGVDESLPHQPCLPVHLILDLLG